MYVLNFLSYHAEESLYQEKKRNMERSVQNTTMEPEDITFQLLREITDGFSEKLKLGAGGFGVVYKGLTKTGKKVAVKRLYDDRLGLHDNQFQNEFYNLKMLNHPNIIGIIGYCYETENIPTEYNGKIVLAEKTYRALCLEYMHNGSLKNHLSDELHELDWYTRYNIIMGICMGLKYLHEDLDHPVYHLDLKPDNILLDEDMVPKLADFGLSRIFGPELTRNTDSHVGTVGYQPPEYIDRGEISKKFDIFSLGVIIIKIVSGPRGYSECAYMAPEEFVDLVQKNWSNILQATCSGSSLWSYCEQVKLCTEIALCCVQKDRHRRPDIITIIENLSGNKTGIGKFYAQICQRDISLNRMPDREINDQQCNLNLMASPNLNLKECHRRNELEFVDERATSSDLCGELVIGRREEKSKILNSLLQKSEDSITILPIYGIGGIGKTTFAKYIYSDAKFKYYSQVWVYVSQIFDLNKIGMSIISQLSEKEYLINERQLIHSCLKKLLDGKKVFIVLDDLWEEDLFKLNDLKAMLMLGKSSNVIVVLTTRSKKIAENICTMDPYKIKHLTNDMCWDIIKQKSLFGSRDDKELLEDIGMEIALKCGGVALAAQCLGYMLQSMSAEEWEKVKDNDIWNESISMDATLPNHVLASLMLSYDSMTTDLRSCFTYCAIFPKGHMIAKDDLIHQWVSLGFIKPKILSTRQLSEKYVVQLLGLSFLQQSKPPLTSGAYLEQVIFFTMHDLVHDLARSIMGNKILDASKQVDVRASCCLYASLNDCSNPLESSMESSDSLSALRFLHCEKFQLHGSAFSPAKSLCVLDLSQCCIQMLSDSIGQLEQLRYLNAPGIQDQEIPNCITRLSKLIYLKIPGSSAISALPESIHEMENLMHVDLSGCSGIEKLPESFGNLKRLMHLDLSTCYRVTGVSEFIGNLRKLQYLNLSYCPNIGALPERLSSLVELQYLNLSWSSYLEGWLESDVLGGLTKLEYLNLSSKYSDIENLPKAIGSFANLKYLKLSGCGRLNQLPNSFEKLKSLVHLDLSYCRFNQPLPEILSGLTKLQNLNLRYCHFSDDAEQNLSGLEKVMKNLTEIRYLNLSGFVDHLHVNTHRLSRLISCLSNLEYLDMSQNHCIHSIHKGLGDLRKLHTLDLSDCAALYDVPFSIYESDSLKFLILKGCHRIGSRYTLPQLSSKVALSQFHVKAGESRSNLALLTDVNPTVELKISGLENVMSIEEAQKIKLKEKRTIESLKFEWTIDAMSFLQDIEVLRELVPPASLNHFELRGYNSVGFPYWLMNIAPHLPYLTMVRLFDLPKCNLLPPLGQLPKLKKLIIRRMASITTIDKGFYGTAKAFPKLNEFYLMEMESLEKWNTTYSDGEDGENKFIFPVLDTLIIRHCPKLRLQPYPPRAKYWDIENSDNVLSSCGEEGQTCASSSASRTYLRVKSSELPLYQWALLHHLPGLTRLCMQRCSDLIISSPEIIQDLSTLKSISIQHSDLDKMPEWLAQLTSLEELDIRYCRAMNSLPQSMTLTNLRRLIIHGCPQLERWCARNNGNLSHQTEIRISEYTSLQYRVTPL